MKKLPQIIHQAYANNNWTGVIQFYTRYGPGDWGQQMMEHIIRCSEKWAAFSADEVARLSTGSYLKGWYVALANNHALACKLTPPGETPEGETAQPHSQIPVLLINGEADPQAPPQNVTGSKDLWPNSLAVIEPYQGHWLSDLSEIYCRWSIMSEFIQSASVENLNLGCLQKVKMPAFDLGN